MSKTRSQHHFDLGWTMNRILLSGFVVISFIAYVIHERIVNPNATTGLTPPQSNGDSSQSVTSSDGNTTSQGLTVPDSIFTPQAASQSNNLASSASTASYKDGTYTGPQVDAYYGLVQVRATVQNGRITNIQFLQYPNDRRTSIRINSIAVPYLQQEGIQAQSARVDIISGATLTSEAFMMSLQYALNSAKN